MADDKKGRGRPEFEATDELRDKVEWYIATGLTQEEIGRAIGCTVPTLNKHFSDNLDNGYARKKAGIVDLMVETAKAGNASLQKRLETIIATRGAAQKFDNPPNDAPQDKPPAERIGKKDQANRDAADAGAGTGWAGDLQPRSVN